MTQRIGRCERRTTETQLEVEIVLDGTGTSEISTGLGFLDHMLTSFARHGRFDLGLRCTGDLEIDDHHSVEDSALALGTAFDAALGERTGIERFGEAHVAMDETLARCVVDLSARPFAVVDLGLKRERIGAVATENLTHFFESFAVASRNTIHVDVLRGANDHHKAEASFKALALALRRAVRPSGIAGAPSTKGVL